MALGVIASVKCLKANIAREIFVVASVDGISSALTISAVESDLWRQLVAVNSAAVASGKSMCPAFQRWLYP